MNIRMNADLYKKAGYTHVIQYKEYMSQFDLFVEKSFPTTADAVQIHLKKLYRDQYDKDGNELIVGIKAVII